MGVDLGELRGRVAIRPWRVGVLVDVSDGVAVRKAIADLSAVWGGMYMPLMDRAASAEDLEHLGKTYDLDAIWGEGLTGDVETLSRKPGWEWQWRGQWGPFGDPEGGFPKRLLPAEAFLGDLRLIQPLWEADDDADLAFASIWGLLDRFDAADEHAVSRPTVGFRRLPEVSEARPIIEGAIVAGCRYLTLDVPQDPGVYLLRPGSVADAVEFWNLRASGSQVVGVPATHHFSVCRVLLEQQLGAAADGSGLAAKRRLPVWGLTDADLDTRRELSAFAERGRWILEEEERVIRPISAFPGLETPFSRNIRADFRPNANSADVALPELPLDPVRHRLGAGIVAADVRLNRVTGLDPRLTASLPPYRRVSQLLKRSAHDQGADHARVTIRGSAFGIDALAGQLSVPFVFNRDVMAVLFGDGVNVNQSETGRFQTRAAEKLGGPFSGMATQPGVRAVLEKAAASPVGVPMPQLWEVMKSARGAWPDQVLTDMSPEEYARHQVDLLMLSGLFVPITKVHCSHCRVESWASVGDLQAVMSCEFCGDDFNLALSQSLSKPEWRYRLAAHLRPDQVQALMPALATSGLLGRMRHVQEPDPPIVLGLEVVLELAKTRVEVDVAVYLPDNDWLAVLGEVKTGNRVDVNDVLNLERLHDHLWERGVRCVLLFATLKQEWTPEERFVLRELVERSKVVSSPHSGLLPNMPLVLVESDVSQTPFSPGQPWRWESTENAGFLGTAITSCKRNLGLVSYALDRGDDGELAVQCEWDE